MATRNLASSVVGVVALSIVIGCGDVAGAATQDRKSPIDLVQVSLNAPGKMKIGKKIRVADEVECVGDEPAPLSFTHFYLSKDDTFDAADILIGRRRVPSLGRGAVSQDFTAVEIPATVEPGVYYFIARANATNTIVERYLDNNTRATKVTIQPADVKK